MVKNGHRGGGTKHNALGSESLQTSNGLTVPNKLAGHGCSYTTLDLTKAYKPINTNQGVDLSIDPLSDFGPIGPGLRAGSPSLAIKKNIATPSNAWSGTGGKRKTRKRNKKNKRKRSRKSIRRKNIRKKTHTRKYVKKRRSRVRSRYIRGGGRMRGGNKDSKLHIPRTSGFGFNGKENTMYGALSTPIPIQKTKCN